MVWDLQISYREYLMPSPVIPANLHWRRDSKVFPTCWTLIAQQTVCTTRSQGKKSHMLVSKMHSGISNTVHLDFVPCDRVGSNLDQMKKWKCSYA